jgi:acyl phosphate:glycerol-3-phosphate acyltransferase
MNTILILLLAYFCGAIPAGYWVVKTLMQVDLTKVGSGGTGATNVLRTAGKGAAAVVFLVDVAKGYVPVLVAILALGNGFVPEIANTPFGPWLPFAAAILAVVGHSKSIFLSWNGGKSAATGFGAMMAMNMPAALCAFAIFVTIVWLTRYVSLASIVAVSCSPILMYLFDPTAIPYIALCLCGAVYVIARHKANIRRLMEGTEPRIGQMAELKADAKP